MEESTEYLRLMSRYNLATVFLAAPTSTDERLKQVAEASTGFVYAVSRTGVTGARTEISQDARTLVERIRRFTRLPIAVGFGISTAEQVAEVGSYAEGAVVGSAIVEAVERAAPEGKAPQAVAELVGRLLRARTEASMAGHARG
jgi:tryptophan synthase alpha chain